MRCTDSHAVRFRTRDTTSSDCFRARHPSVNAGCHGDLPVLMSCSRGRNLNVQLSRSSEFKETSRMSQLELTALHHAGPRR